MHPDQATEAIVDCAIELGRPWAIVPCCVFPHSYPGAPPSRYHSGPPCYHGSIRRGNT